MSTKPELLIVGALLVGLLAVIAGGVHLDYRRGECRKAAIEHLNGTDLALAIQACE
jgi:hypothetical protein